MIRSWDEAQCGYCEGEESEGKKGEVGEHFGLMGWGIGIEEVMLELRLRISRTLKGF